MAKTEVERPEPYDPLDYDNLAQNVVRALMEQPCAVLPPPASFMGVGVYAIYYTGNLPYYKAIKGVESPIYVGSAVPKGKRKGGHTRASADRILHKRLADHAKSIAAANNLCVDDFCCRYLVVVPVWTSLAERFLIEHYRPVWNTIVEGFGNHAPGSGRSSMKRPRWDVVHPGRAWAEKLTPAETAEDIIAALTR